MKIQDLRNYAASHGMRNAKNLEKGTEKKFVEFVKQRMEVVGRCDS